MGFHHLKESALDSNKLYLHGSLKAMCSFPRPVLLQEEAGMALHSGSALDFGLHPTLKGEVVAPLKSGVAL